MFDCGVYVFYEKREFPCFGAVCQKLMLKAFLFVRAFAAILWCWAWDLLRKDFVDSKRRNLWYMVAFGHHRIMCVNNIHSQVWHHRGVEEKEEEEPLERSLQAPQEEAVAKARPAKAAPTPANASPPAKVGLNPGYSRPAWVSYVLALKPPMSSISLVTKLPLAHGCLYIWVKLPLPKIDMNWDKNWHDASLLVGTLLDLPSRNHSLSLGSLIFGEFYLDLDLLHTRVCNSIQLIGLLPTWNSIPWKSISHKEFYYWSLFLVILWSWWIGPTRTTGVYLVCVSFPFDLCVVFIMFIMFFVFVLLPRHKSRESVKIGPHPRGQPLSTCLFYYAWI
jgi:hypothetical protein